MRSLARSSLLLLIGASAACGADEGGAAPLPPEPASLLIENQSNYDLLELRLHEESSYSGAPNMLPGGMPRDGSAIFHRMGAWYVTVVREKLPGVGPLIAFTTASPIDLEPQTGYRLIVFDQSFRLFKDVDYFTVDAAPRDALSDAGTGGEP